MMTLVPRYALNSALNSFPWLGTRRFSSSWTMTCLRKSAGWVRRPVSRVTRPAVEQLPHLRVMGRMWICLGLCMDCLPGTSSPRSAFVDVMPPSSDRAAPPVRGRSASPLLLVWRIPVLSQQPPHDGAHLGAGALFHGPVDGDVVPHGLDQLTGDSAEGFITQDFDGAVVDFQGIVEGQLVVGQAKVLAPLMGLPHLSGQLDQLRDHLGGLDGAVLVELDRLLQHLQEGAGLDHVLAGASLDLVVQELAEKLQGQVLVRKAAYLGQELVGEDRDFGFLQAGVGENVNDAVGGDRLGYELADRVVQVLGRLGTDARVFDQPGPDGLEEADLITDLQGLFVGDGQGERLREQADLLDEPGGEAA